MEKIFNPRCQDLINIREFFFEYKNNLCPSSVKTLPTTYEDIKNLLAIYDGGEEELLEDSISLNNLAQPDDMPINDFNLHELQMKRRHPIVEIPKKAMRLKSVQERVEEQSAGNSSDNIQTKYNRYKYVSNQHKNEEGACDLKPLNDIFIVIRVYEPFVYKRGMSTSRKPRLSQEFAVLGCQRLSELRDRIFCHCKFGPFYDISDDYSAVISPDSDQVQNPTDDPGFFFITDTFYNDARKTDTDYSIEIRNWTERQPEIGPVQVKSMHDTIFHDLNIRLGFPQVYKHYGNCEHVLTFTDIRLLASDDSLKLADYPMLRMVSSTRSAMCIICGVMEARFVIKNSTVHIHEPAYLCKNCMVSLHYVDGKKIGKFQAYRYFGNRPQLN